MYTGTKTRSAWTDRMSRVQVNTASIVITEELTAGYKLGEMFKSSAISAGSTVHKQQTFDLAVQNRKPKSSTQGTSVSAISACIAVKF